LVEVRGVGVGQVAAALVGGLVGEDLQTAGGGARVVGAGLPAVLVAVVGGQDADRGRGVRAAARVEERGEHGAAVGLVLRGARVRRLREPLARGQADGRAD